MIPGIHNITYVRSHSSNKCFATLKKNYPTSNTENNQPINKTSGCSPKTDSKSPLPNISPTQLIDHQNVKLVPT